MSAGFVMTNNNLIDLGLDPYSFMLISGLKRYFPQMRPSVDRLAAVCKMSRATVIRRLKLLVTMGILKITKRKRGQCNLYSINERYLTEKEAAAQRAGTWYNVVAKKVISRVKKVVSQRSVEQSKVVSESDTNKNEYKQEVKYINYHEALKTNPELLQWMK